MKKPARYAALLALLFAVSGAQMKPEWCQELPRPEYQRLPRLLADNSWFEVYEVVNGVFAIYEPHQAEETISYLITGDKRAVLFDTGMGIGDLRHVVDQLTGVPVIVLNSHTHNDHVGDNWRFATIYAPGHPVHPHECHRIAFRCPSGDWPRNDLRATAQGFPGKELPDEAVEDFALSPRRRED